MPREAIDDQLDGFRKEIEGINKTLRIISHVCKNDDPSFHIRSISTNDFSLSLNVNIDLGEIIICVLVGLHLAQNELREKKKALETLSDLPKDLLKGFSDFVNSTVRDKIKEMVTKLREDCANAVDAEKVEQTKGPLSDAIFDLAAKLERGFNVDVRVGEATEAELGEGEPVSAQLKMQSERLKQLGQKANELKVIERQSAGVFLITDQSDAEE